MAQKERVTFNTGDGVVIVGNFFAGPSPDAPAVLLLHMMPVAKESWDDFAQKLTEAGFQVLAIDLRGHGESINVSDGRTLDYNKFGDKEHQNSILDVEAAHAWLVERGVAAENIFVGGASIGANLTLQYLTDHSKSRAGFLLSPGLDYRGVKADELMGKLQPDQRVYLAAADDDSYSAQTVRALNEMGQAQKVLKVYESGGHGTNMFGPHPELMEELVEWLEK